MPLENNAPSGSPGFSRNVATEIKAGKPVKQAVAIAYSKARGDAQEEDCNVLDAILDSADQLYAKADASSTAQQRKEAYDREQSKLYQANAEKARKEAASTPGFSAMSPSEQTKLYRKLEDKYDGERRRAYAAGRRAAVGRSDSENEEDCNVMDESEETRERHEGRLTENEREQIGRPGSEHREEMPEDVFLEPASRKYPVKEKKNGSWVYDRELLLAAARRARMQGDDELAQKADRIRGTKFGSAEES